jgi:Phytanoyl-CoA dioxygenase (PhyH)
VWWPKRTVGEQPESATATIEPPSSAEEELDGDLDQLLAEIERVTEANLAAPSREAERRLVRLRHLAGMRLVDEAPGASEFVAPDTDRLPAGDPLPEVAAADLTSGLIRAGVLRDGCVLVRGLVPRERAQALAERIDRAFSVRERQEAGRSVEDGYYEEFQPHPRYGPVVGRGWIEQGGGLLAADAPMLHFEMMELFRAVALRELVTGYLGEPALISVHKTTLRKADPSVPGAWHQDGFFMGEVRSLNLWLSLSRCGDEAPGLDLLPKRLDRYLATNTEEAALDYTISQHKVDEAGVASATQVIRPIFEPGDALFFDELFLHQTGSEPSMRKPRYAVENWFFGGSGFPEEYAPIAV